MPEGVLAIVGLYESMARPASVALRNRIVAVLPIAPDDGSRAKQRSNQANDELHQRQRYALLLGPDANIDPRSTLTLTPICRCRTVSFLY